MGCPVPPWPPKPDWMTDDEYREQMILPYIRQLESLQSRNGGAGSLLALTMTLLVPFVVALLIGIAATK